MLCADRRSRTVVPNSEIMRSGGTGRTLRRSRHRSVGTRSTRQGRHSLDWLSPEERKKAFREDSMARIVADVNLDCKQRWDVRNDSGGHVLDIGDPSPCRSASPERGKSRTSCRKRVRDNSPADKCQDRGGKAHKHRRRSGSPVDQCLGRGETVHLHHSHGDSPTDLRSKDKDVRLRSGGIHLREAVGASPMGQKRHHSSQSPTALRNAQRVSSRANISLCSAARESSARCNVSEVSSARCSVSRTGSARCSVSGAGDARSSIPRGLSVPCSVSRARQIREDSRENASGQPRRLPALRPRPGVSPRISTSRGDQQQRPRSRSFTLHHRRAKVPSRSEFRR